MSEPKICVTKRPARKRPPRILYTWSLFCSGAHWRATGRARGVAVPPPGELVSSGPVPQPDMNSFSYALNLSAPWEGRQRRQGDGKAILSCDVFMALRNTGANMQKVEGYNWKGIVVRNARGRGREGGRCVRGGEGKGERQIGR